jgi:hypothetical protein
MKNTLKRLLTATAVAAILLCVQTTSSLCRAQSLPDLKVRSIKAGAANVVTVYVLNNGQADANGCYVTLYLLNPSDKKFIWKTQGTVEPLSTMKTVGVEFGMGEQALGGLLVRVMVDSSQRINEENEENNWGELLVPADTPGGRPPPIKGPAPSPSGKYPGVPPPIKLPKEKPRLSPDVAVVNIEFKDEYMVGVFKNVGDRDYHPFDRDIKDSFRRVIRLKRIVQTKTQTYTQEIGTGTMGGAPVGKAFRRVFQHPKKDPAATKYTWILTIEGDDPNMQNNSFKTVQVVTRID